MNGTGKDITGRYVVLRASYHGEDWREPEHLVFRAQGGFGCRPDTIGTAVVGFYPSDGERCRVEGPAVERLATPEEVEALFARVFEGPDDGPCPGCCEKWTANGARDHADGCEYLAWMAVAR